MAKKAMSLSAATSVNSDDEDASGSVVASIDSPTSFRGTRNAYSGRSSEVDLHSRIRSRQGIDENTNLLGPTEGPLRAYGGTPRSSLLSQEGSPAQTPIPTRYASFSGSLGLQMPGSGTATRTATSRGLSLDQSLASLWSGRVWYDQFTSTDWVQDTISDANRVRLLRGRKDFMGRVQAVADKPTGWVLVALIGVLVALMAYIVDISESFIFDVKEGYCSRDWKVNRKHCCRHSEPEQCRLWVPWSQILTGRTERSGIVASNGSIASHTAPGVGGAVGSRGTVGDIWLDYAAYVFVMVAFACLACLLTLTTKTLVPSAVQIATLDEDLAASGHLSSKAIRKAAREQLDPAQPRPGPTVYYPAAGSGVAEVKVILSGFVLHGYLGFKTLIIKTLALILSVASGLSLGKEGPFVHIATCIGNIACRLFPKYYRNDAKRREVLSASAASGVAVAFGAPIGGVLFSLEEVSYYFPPKTLFRTFLCTISAALMLKFLNPYGTGKIVLFEVRYDQDFRSWEMIVFILLGVAGGVLGACFIKASKFWAQWFRTFPLIKRWPLLEVALVATLTGLVSFWNRYAKLNVTELLLELASPCNLDERETSGLCPSMEDTPEVIKYLVVAFLIKSLLTVITFGTKIPAGIYVPSMVVGGFMGRIVGHMVEYAVYKYPEARIFAGCLSADGSSTCIVPGVYAMVAAGATMCGVTRLSVTLAVILFELSGSLDHVLPFSVGVMVSKWTADAIEPLSIYDLLTDMNHYPYLDNKNRPIFDADLSEITPRVSPSRIIDISESVYVSASKLRKKLDKLHSVGDLDGGLPLVKNGILVGLIPAPDLEFALDRLDMMQDVKCLMAISSWTDSEAISTTDTDPTDFTTFIDQAPVSLDIRSPLDLVYECFVKLGLRYICVLKDGKYAGMVHKKSFVKYLKELEPQHG